MSTARLTFLYPHLFRSVRLGEPSTRAAVKSRCRKSAATQCRRYVATFSTTASTTQAPYERHGKAVEPQPATDAVKLPQPAPGPQARIDEVAESAEPKAGSEDLKATAPAETEKGTAPPPKEKKPKARTPHQVAAEEKMEAGGPMDAVLHMPAPSQMTHQHISTPPYVHHFDTYTLVKQLEMSGYTKDQAITVMKAVRTLLAQNLAVAQKGLVSKSDVDNETYLFRAACSELSTEVTNNRRTADEQTRQQRTLLQHEVDILGQKLSQDLMTLKDDVRGMFNDRKMAVSEEQNRLDGALQQVNLHITSTLTSDSRSEIEGLRWILIRRSVLGIIFMAVCTLATLRYATYINRETQAEREAEKRHEETLRNAGGRVDHAPAPDAAEILAAN